MTESHASSAGAASTAGSETRGVAPRVAVLVPLPLAGAYDYLAGDIPLAPGDFVMVPLGRRETLGVVWDGAPAGAVASAKLRPVTMRLAVVPMGKALRRFVEWVAAYTMTPPGAVLRMTMSVAAALEEVKPLIGYRLAEDVDGKGGVVRASAGVRRVMALAAEGPPRPAIELAREAGVTPGVVKRLIERRALAGVEIARPRAFASPDPDGGAKTLSPAQAETAEALVGIVNQGRFAVAVLDGVTGSGKTETYLETVAACVRQGRQALVLVPEIALSAQWLDRFRERFGVRPALWHSDLTGSERRLAWRAVASGEARVVVGARSALFLPFAELGLIVVDEEHEAAYKQEDGVAYHARDMAVVRARLEDRPIVLVSATPSLETVMNLRQLRYRGFRLPERHGGATMPTIRAVDLRADRPPRQGWLAPSLRQALRDTLEGGEQALLFLNRRGYAPLTLCRNCGHRFGCPNCSTWLVEHRLSGRLQCHHCGYSTAIATACPACGAEGSLAACGPGIERLAEEVAALLPQARLALIASDTLGGPRAIEAFIRRVENHEVDIVIGTQILAKGHHFPMLTLVGIVDADLGLYGGDLRAAERTFQLLHQVAGRAGRAERPGSVLVQTHDPTHPVIAALIANDRARFIESEASERRAGAMPPFARLVAIILSSPDADAVDGAARALKRAAPPREGIEIIGPAPAPIYILRGRHRRRLLVRTRRDIAPQPFIREWLTSVKLASNVRLAIDVDPYSFL